LSARGLKVEARAAENFRFAKTARPFDSAQGESGAPDHGLKRRDRFARFRGAGSAALPQSQQCPSPGAGLESPPFTSSSDDHLQPMSDHEPSAYPGDPYAQDRELVEILMVWSLRDALQVQRMLEVAGIPFYMGTENATAVEAVISNF